MKHPDVDFNMAMLAQTPLGTCWEIRRHITATWRKQACVDAATSSHRIDSTGSSSSDAVTARCETVAGE